MIRTAVIINLTQGEGGAARLAGLSLADRAVLSAQHAGIEEILLLAGNDPALWLVPRARAQARWIAVDAQTELAALQAAREHLKQPFLVLFADSVVESAALTSLRRTPLNGRVLVRVPPDGAADGVAASVFLASPDLLQRLDRLPRTIETVEDLWQRGSDGETGSTRQDEGRTWERTTAEPRLETIERELSQQQLKSTDGVYARFNKTVIARPLIRFFLRTPATPNFITGLGFLLALVSGGVFALGGYGWSLAGALLAYASAMMDHVDGMVARLKFQQSHFGTWLETVADYASYIFIFLGMAFGLYRETGFTPYVFIGGLFVFGTLMSFILQARQRQRISGDNPGDYIRRWHAKVEEHSGNFFDWFGRQCYFFVRRAVLPYYVIAFCLLDLRGLLLGLSTIGANLVWILLLYNDRLFRISNAKSTV